MKCTQILKMEDFIKTIFATLLCEFSVIDGIRDLLLNEC